jgi:hypothetical protein
MSKYYDITISACGFVNRVREVKVEQGENYLVCTFAALRGEQGQRQALTYFDAKAATDEVSQVLQRFQHVSNDRSRTVFASVTLSDLTVAPFVFRKGPRQGETGFALKSRLIAISTLALEGQVVYRRPNRVPPSQDPASPDFQESELGRLIHDPVAVAELSPEDPEFAVKRQQLEAAGYRRDAASGKWVLAPNTH